MGPFFTRCRLCKKWSRIRSFYLEVTIHALLVPHSPAIVCENVDASKVHISGFVPLSFVEYLNVLLRYTILIRQMLEKPEICICGDLLKWPYMFYGLSVPY